MIVHKSEVTRNGITRTETTEISENGDMRFSLGIEFEIFGLTPINPNKGKVYKYKSAKNPPSRQNED